jgi:hypothetical protein
MTGLMDNCQLIVCERSGAWAAALGQLLAGHEVRMRQTRSLAECQKELTTAPNSFVALELTAENAAAVVELLWASGRNHPQATCVALAAGEGAAFEWMVREAGAAHVVTSRRDLPEVAKMVRRHCSRVPGRRASIQEQIWASLPWSD